MDADEVTRELFAGKLDVLKKIGSGGMAQIFLARRPGSSKRALRSSQSLDDYVVVKMILPALASDRRVVEHFLDEARVLAMLRHENIVEVLDVGSADGLPFIAMEYLHGQNLRTLAVAAKRREGKMPLDVALDVVARAAEGLHYAHTRKDAAGKPLAIVHRDVSPHNVVVTYDGRVKVIDFGIAKAAMARREATMVGVVKGKLRYLSPEQALSKPLDARTDVFALGVILYELTTMHRAFPQDNDSAVLLAVSTGDVQKPSALVADYPRALEDVVLKALAPDVDARFQTAAALVSAIDDVAQKLKTKRASQERLAAFVRALFPSSDLEKSQDSSSRPRPSAIARTAIKANPFARPDSAEEPVSTALQSIVEAPVDTARALDDDVHDEDTFALDDGDTSLGWNWIGDDPRSDPVATTESTFAFVSETPRAPELETGTSSSWRSFAPVLVVAAIFVGLLAIGGVAFVAFDSHDDEAPIATAPPPPVAPPKDAMPPAAVAAAVVDAGTSDEAPATSTTPADAGAHKHRALKPLAPLADGATMAQQIGWLDANCRARVVCAADMVARKKALSTLDLAAVRAFPDQVGRCVRQCREKAR